MKIINAVWEKGNLGVDTAEIIFESSDSVDSFKEIDELAQNYQVLKIPNRRIDIVSHAEKSGFCFAETQINLISYFQDPAFSLATKRLLNTIIFEEADSKDSLAVLKELSSGSVFSSDRIALDSHFNVQIAGRRYSNWIKTILGNNGKLLVSKVGGNLAGFVSVDFKDNYADAILGGALSSNKIPGMGVIAAYAGIQYAKKHGAKYIKTSVSSNNVPAIRINLSAGYEVVDTSYVLVRHINL